MNTKNFLDFNGDQILFAKENDIYYIALKPICRALKIDYIRSFKNAKNDEILGPELSEQTIQVTKNGKTQGRGMTCIPEEFIYGWLFSLRSESPELVNYKRTCYRLLFKHFHGSITNRKEYLVERRNLEKRMKEIKNVIKQNDPLQIELCKLEIQKKKINRELDIIDEKILNESTLFSDDELNDMQQ